MRGFRWLAMAGGGMVLVLAVAGGVGQGLAAGDPASSGYTLVARADPMAVQMSASDAPVVPGGEVVYATPSSAQATADSLGTSRAFASAPYAGDFFTTLPGTINGLSAGKFPPMPPFAFYVSSEYPSRRSQEFDAGSWRVKATSGDGTSTGDARIGVNTTLPEIAAAAATASVVRDAATGLLIAESSSEVQPLALTDDVRIGEVRSTVQLRFDPAHPERGVEKTSTFRISSITVAGLNLGLTDKGVTVLGNPVVPVDPAALAGVLGNAGVEIEYVPKAETATSLASASARITILRDAPRAGMTRTTFVVGQASATVDPSAPVAAPVPVELPPGFLDVTPLPAEGAPALSPAGPAATTPPMPAPAVPTPVTSPRPAGSGQPDLATAAPAPGTQPAVVPVTAPAAAAATPLADTARLYPVLVLGALAALLVSRRQAWLDKAAPAPGEMTGAG